MAKHAIKLNEGNTLAALGQLYRNQREALKEYISNAIDAWRAAGANLESPCRIDVRIAHHSIRVETFGYPGMDRADFARAMTSVSDSEKAQSAVPLIGRLGIGLFAFSQFATRATFLSKKHSESPTYLFTLAKGEDQYFEGPEATKRQWLKEPGVIVEFTGLANDPTEKNAQLHPRLFARYLQDYFRPALRAKEMLLTLWLNGEKIEVEAPAISLEPIGEGFKGVFVNGNASMPFKSELYFQPDGTGRVGLRHANVFIIRDLRDVDPLWEGFEESAFASGFVDGALAVDFLNPLPSRTDFERNETWERFVTWLRNVAASIDAEVEDKRDELEIAKLDEVKRAATKLAQEAFKSELLADLPFLTGMMRKRARRTLVPRTQTPKSPRIRSAAYMGRQMSLGEKPPPGMSFSFREEPLDDVRRHSAFDPKAGIIRINSVNPHYKRFTGGKAQGQIWYSALMIGKETISAYDMTKGSDDYLERLVSFICEVQDKKASA